MKYPAYNRRLTLRGNLIEFLEVNNTFSESQLFDHAVKQILKRDEAQSQIGEVTKLLVEADLMRRNVSSSVEVLIKERDELQGTINGLKQLVELPESAGLTELFNAVEALELNKSELLATQPQLSEIRYVLHGDIQPCSVLYSDDTTTLLRLDEGDIMCETDTIEWSDSVTYRCQELLRSTDVVPSALHRCSVALSQLVRDERILLNDNGDEFPSADEAYFREGVEQPCNLCGHVFDVDSTTCPMCNTIRTPNKHSAPAPAQPDIPSEWTDNNSPTPLR